MWTQLGEKGGRIKTGALGHTRPSECPSLIAQLCLTLCNPMGCGSPARGDLLCDLGSSRVGCDNGERWDGVGGGREAHEGEDIRIHTADSCCCMAEIQCNVVKQFSSN